MIESAPRRFALFVALGALSITACDGKTQDQRCDEILEYLEGREQVLDRHCEVDTDCQVVFVRPDHPIAATRQPDDPALARALATARADCGPIPRAEGSLAAVCLERVIDVPDPTNPQQTIQENIGRACVLRGQYTVPDTGSADVGPDAVDTAPDAPCGCTSDAACASGETCHSCVCVPETLCGQACIAADVCGALGSLGLGNAADVCAAGCEASVTDNPAVYQAFAQCLRNTGCETIDDCGDLIP